MASIRLYILLTVKQTVVIIDQTVKKRNVIMGIAIKYQSFSKAGNESTTISVVSRGVKETLTMVSLRKEVLSGYNVLRKKLYCGCKSSTVLWGHVF